jgi:transcriptional regulator GlxA family with amidase domain
MKNSKRTIGFLVVPPFELLDLAGPIAVFSNANVVEGNRCLYEIKIISAEKSRYVTSADGSSMGPAMYYAKFEDSLDTLLVVAGTGALKPITPSLCAWLGQRAKRVRRPCAGSDRGRSGFQGRKLGCAPISAIYATGRRPGSIQHALA